MAASPSAGSAPSSQEQPRVRVEFPETWLWSESSTGYHLSSDVIYAAKFTSPSWCLCWNYPWSSIAVWWQFITKNTPCAQFFSRYFGRLFASSPWIGKFVMNTYLMLLGGHCEHQMSDDEGWQRALTAQGWQLCIDPAGLTASIDPTGPTALHRPRRAESISLTAQGW